MTPTSVASTPVPAPAPEATPRTPDTAGRPYLAGLDGLRALAVTAVLLFHGEWSHARGGYLGVSLFFTISGFLIVSLLLVKRRETGRVRLSRFWTHRARRLLPAAFVTIAGTWIATVVFHLGSARTARGDALASMFYVANWRFIATSQSYDALFRAPSAFLHFWSLSIEEQFYLLIAPSIVLLFAAPARWRRPLLGAFGAVVAIAYLIAVRDSATAYLNTFVRLPEVLAGGVLAFLIGRRCFGDRRPISFAWRRAVDVVSIVGLAVFVLLVARAGAPESFAASGWLPLVACCSAAMVAGCSLEGTVLGRVFALGPLPALGRLSYTLYLVHWPIFLVLTEARVGFGGVALFAVRVLFSVAVAMLLFRWVEGPARRNLRTPRAAFAVLVPAGVVVCAIVLAISPRAETAQPDFAATMRAFAKDRPAVPGRVTAEMFGDSTALMTGSGIGGWGGDTHELQFVGADTKLGCGIGRGGDRDNLGVIDAVPAECDWTDTWPKLLNGHPGVAVAIVQVGPWDVDDRKLPGDDVWRAPGDPVYDRYLRGEIDAALDMFHSHHVPVVWLTAPHIEPGKLQVPPPDHPYPSGDPARTDRLNALLREAVATRPDAAVVDLSAYLRSRPTGEMDPALRPDGVHFTTDSSRIVANWLGPQVVDAVTKMRARLGLPPLPPSETASPPTTA